MIFENWSQFCINFAPSCNNLASVKCKAKCKHKCKAKLKRAHLRESKRILKGCGTFPPIGRKVVLTRHFDNSLSVYLFFEFEP